MGTTYQVKITHVTLSEDNIQHLRSRVDSALVEVNRQMSPYDPASEISQFNNFHETSGFVVSPEFAGVVSKAINISRISGGAFDVTIGPLVDLWGFGKRGQRITPPSDGEINKKLEITGIDNLSVIEGSMLKKNISDLQIDLSAIAKGFGVDVVTEILESEGYDNYMVEIGGEVYARGLNAQKSEWKIGIDTPQLASLPGQNIKAILLLKGVAVATSGDYRNYFEYEEKLFSHMINPFTGRPVTHNLASVTVIAQNCADADAYATALLVMGVEKGLELIDRIEGIETYMIVRENSDNYKIFQSKGFNKYLDNQENIKK